MLDKKPRLARVEREETVTIHEDENQHLWALSYADFLMALLAFFILFFSADDDKRDDLIHNIAVHFDGQQTGDKGAQARSPSSIKSGLFEQLKTERIEVIEAKKNLEILLPDNFFLPGQYLLGEEQKATMERLFAILRPYSDSVDIYFEGHADFDPVTKSKSRILTDNYVLSSLRAATALQFARTKGFDEKRLFIAATGSHGRGTRSLSVRLQARGDRGE